MAKKRRSYPFFLKIKHLQTVYRYIYNDSHVHKTICRKYNSPTKNKAYTFKPGYFRNQQNDASYSLMHKLTNYITCR